MKQSCLVSCDSDEGLPRMSLHPNVIIEKPHFSHQTEPEFLHSISNPKKIVFVDCDGLVIAPMASAFYNYYTQSSVSFSATTNLETPQRYLRPLSCAIEAMQEQRISIKNYAPTTITRKLLVSVDLAVIFCPQMFLPYYFTEFSNVKSYPLSVPLDLDMDYARKICQEVKNVVLKLLKEG